MCYSKNCKTFCKEKTIYIIYIHRCIANNEFLKKTKKSKEAKLTVISRPEGNGSYIPPLLFPQISYNHWLLNGSNLSLVCATSGYPPPLITWSFIPRYIGISHTYINYLI